MTTTKPKFLDKEVALEIAQDFLSKLEFFGNQASAPNAADLERFLSPNFQLISNGRSEANSLHEYLSRIEKFQKTFSHIEITNLSVDVLSSGYQIVIRYEIHLTPKTGSKRTVEISAIASLDNQHFTKWDQVASERGAENWSQ